jgi:hypothetical protein
MCVIVGFYWCVRVSIQKGYVITFFWICTIILLLLALGFVLPRLHSFRAGVLVTLGLAAVTYSLYGQWGSSSHLDQYYSKEEDLYRTKQFEFRKLLTEFKKQEFRLRLRIEEDPDDHEAQWQLFDLLAIKALQNREYEQAMAYWEAALKKLPANNKNNEIKERILNQMKALNKKKV